MDSTPTKPKPPPKPSPLRTKELITAERYFQQHPVISREKPPLAPKPVLQPNRASSSGSQLYIRRRVIKSVQLTETQDQTEHTVIQEQCDSLSVISESVNSYDTEKLIQDTWASLQERTVQPINSNDDQLLNKYVKNSSSLYSCDLLNTRLPLKENSINKSDKDSSDVSNDQNIIDKINNRPSLQLSPPTPDSESEGDWVLVKTETRSDSELPTDTENLLNDSSLLSNCSLISSEKSVIPDWCNPNINVSQSPSSRLSTSTSDGDVTLRNRKSSEHSRTGSWSEETNTTRTRTDSIGNESFDGSNNTVRRRISSFFGSFGKGSKTKEKRESSLFYCSTGDESSQIESSDSGKASMTSLNESNIANTPIPNNNGDSPILNELKETLCIGDRFDGESNRSSVSDESFDGDQQSKSNGLTSNNENNVSSEDPIERKKRKCFFIVNELITSEKVFIDVLKLLCHDFKKAVDDASNQQKSPVIPSSDFNKIINNLPQLLSLNEDLLKDIESRLEKWHEQPKVADVIAKKGPFLKLYSSYIQNFEAQTDFLDDCCEKYRKFAQVVKDFEKSERCKKLALKHYMLKPIQRIPQYRLLLDDYLEHQESDWPDYEDTQAALRIVCDVANHANHSIKQGDHFSKLLSIQSQLGDYEIIKPGRHFVKEGELYKLSRKDMQLRFFILLSDCLLYTSYYGSMTGLKVKYKLPLAGMKVSTSHNTDCGSEFSIITSTRSFILRAKSKDECRAWVDALQSAIQDYNSRQMTFFNRHTLPMSASAEPLKIGREAPVWIQDKRVTMCQICTAEFTITYRRHHCRACGKVVCSACSDFKAPMLYLHFSSERVCTHCYKYLLNELDDPQANMTDVVMEELKIMDMDELAIKMIEIRSLFKKFGQSSGKKTKKYIPQRLKEVTANDSGSQMSGWLLRRSRTRWKRLWFVLKEQVLYAYKASEDVVASESIPVLGYMVEIIPEAECDDIAGESKSLFKLVHPGQPPLVFATDSSSAERWIQSLKEATLLK